MFKPDSPNPSAPQPSGCLVSPDDTRVEYDSPARFGGAIIFAETDQVAPLYTLVKLQDAP